MEKEAKLVAAILTDSIIISEAVILDEDYGRKMNEILELGGDAKKYIDNNDNLGNSLIWTKKIDIGTIVQSRYYSDEYFEVIEIYEDTAEQRIRWRYLAVLSPLGLEELNE